MTDRPPIRRVDVVCSECGAQLAPLDRTCSRCPDALPRTDYAETRFRPEEAPGLFRFRGWLPCDEVLETDVGPVVFQSRRLGPALGLDDLAIAFSGYEPALGAWNPTGTFKDFEALPTLLHMRQHKAHGVVLASAGSTARAFAHAAGRLEFPTLIVAPEAAAASIWVPGEASDAVRLVTLAGSVDYAAAIRLASRIASRFGIHNEGGARNVARRDGMGTVILEYARHFGALPAHYVQAVGSGTGAIAAWEAASRLVRSGAVAGHLPSLHLGQNAPFSPLHDAWSCGRAIDPERDVGDQLRRIATLAAPVLANRTPPYALRGGVRDALEATDGHTYAIPNGAIAAAQELYETTERTPIGPESGAALAALQEAVAAGTIRRQDAVLLHVTGNATFVERHGVECRPVPVWRCVSPDIETALRSLAPALEA